MQLQILIKNTQSKHQPEQEKVWKFKCLSNTYLVVAEKQNNKIQLNCCDCQQPLNKNHYVLNQFQTFIGTSTAVALQ